MNAANAVGELLARLQSWWRRENDLGSLNEHEIRLVASDLGIAPSDLKDLAARGPAAADLLFERMEVLGLSRIDVAGSAMGLLRDLQINCSRCGAKGICERDLTTRPNKRVWQEYCPNAVTLTSLIKLKAGASARASASR